MRRWLLFLLLLLIAVTALYTWGSLRYVYSSGERAGYVQKFSNEGWLCKTWEGELAMVNIPGQPADLFPFSVRDDAIAVQIQEAVGKRVALTYQYHPGVPTTCFGDTKYHVVGVRVIDQP
jgi:hypothetical protein